MGYRRYILKDYWLEAVSEWLRGLVRDWSGHSLRMVLRVQVTSAHLENKDRMVFWSPYLGKAQVVCWISDRQLRVASACRTSPWASEDFVGSCYRCRRQETACILYLLRRRASESGRVEGHLESCCPKGRRQSCLSWSVEVRMGGPLKSCCPKGCQQNCLSSSVEVRGAYHWC